jgi:Type II secretory pathway, component PulF
LFGVFGITGFICFVTLPQLLPIFVSLKVSLPPTTQFLFNFSHFVTANAIYIVAGAVLSVILIRLMFLNRTMKYFFHKISLKIPVFGPLTRNAQITRLTQVLGTLLVAGVDIVRALDITSESLNNLVFCRELKRIGTEVTRQGVNIADCLNPKYFPPIVMQMIRVGEKTGTLDESFRYISEYLTKEIDDAVNNMTTIIEPILLLIMGVIVGFVAISVITPIYKITEGIHR